MALWVGCGERVFLMIEGGFGDHVGLVVIWEFVVLWSSVDLVVECWFCS